MKNICFREWVDLEKLAKDAKVDITGIDKKELAKGINVEKEHDGKMGKDIDIVNSKSDLLKIAIAHLREDPKYYTKLAKIEKD
jgi:hypothetical protein